MGDRAVFGWREPDREGSTESDRGEHDVAHREVGTQLVIHSVAFDEGCHQGLRSGLEIRPVGVLEKRMDHVHDTDPAVHRFVQVVPNRIQAVGVRGNDCFACVDGAFQHVTGHRVKQRLSVREVSIHGADPHCGALGDRVARRFTPCFEDESDRYLEDALAVLPGVGSHLVVARRVVVSDVRSISGVYSSVSSFCAAALAAPAR